MLFAILSKNSNATVKALADYWSTDITCSKVISMANLSFNCDKQRADLFLMKINIGKIELELATEYSN